MELNQVNVGASAACIMDTLCLLGDGISYNDNAYAIVSVGYQFQRDMSMK